MSNKKKLFDGLRAVFGPSCDGRIIKMWNELGGVALDRSQKHDRFEVDFYIGPELLGEGERFEKSREIASNAATRNAKHWLKSLNPPVSEDPLLTSWLFAIREMWVYDSSERGELLDTSVYTLRVNEEMSEESVYDAKEMTSRRKAAPTAEGASGAGSSDDVTVNSPRRTRRARASQCQESSESPAASPRQKAQATTAAFKAGDRILVPWKMTDKTTEMFVAVVQTVAKYSKGNDWYTLKFPGSKRDHVMSSLEGARLVSRNNALGTPGKRKGPRSSRKSSTKKQKIKDDRAGSGASSPSSKTIKFRNPGGSSEHAAKKKHGTPTPQRTEVPKKIVFKPNASSASETHVADPAPSKSQAGSSKVKPISVAQKKIVFKSSTTPHSTGQRANTSPPKSSSSSSKRPLSRLLGRSGSGKKIVFRPNFTPPLPEVAPNMPVLKPVPSPPWVDEHVELLKDMESQQDSHVAYNLYKRLLLDHYTEEQIEKKRKEFYDP
jgi:hypothetical protein